MKYTFYWLTGRKEILEGEKPHEALMLAGYGGGILRALDFFVQGENEEYIWNKKENKWKKRTKQDTRTVRKESK